jgi:tetraacyldisaccharide 4'-kinase
MKFVRILLFPFAVLYDVITTIRNFFYDIKVFSSSSFKTPTIVVGNLSVGGTGKTPQIEYLVRLLKEKYKIAILSRGYKRKTSGYLLLNKSHTYLDSGDEPMQFFKKFKNITVAVDENRTRGVNTLLENENIDVILLDDAYQHRKVKGGFNVLLTKYDDLFTDDYLLPTGGLRESRRGANRANVILVTKSPVDLSLKQSETILNKLKAYQKPVFFTAIKYANEIKGTVKGLTLDSLKSFEVLLITGIANPKSLLSFFNEENIKYNHLEYADHHHFSEAEINNIQKEFTCINSERKIILTTEKDYIRLSSSIKELAYIEIETYFLNHQGLLFNQLLENYVK